MTDDSGRRLARLQLHQRPRNGAEGVRTQARLSNLRGGQAMTRRIVVCFTLLLLVAAVGNRPEAALTIPEADGSDGALDLTVAHPACPMVLSTDLCEIDLAQAQDAA